MPTRVMTGWLAGSRAPHTKAPARWTAQAHRRGAARRNAGVATDRLATFEPMAGLCGLDHGQTQNMKQHVPTAKVTAWSGVSTSFPAATAAATAAAQAHALTAEAVTLFVRECVCQPQGCTLQSAEWWSLRAVVCLGGSTCVNATRTIDTGGNAGAVTGMPTRVMTGWLAGSRAPHTKAPAHWTAQAHRRGAARRNAGVATDRLATFEPMAGLCGLDHGQTQNMKQHVPTAKVTAWSGVLR